MCVPNVSVSAEQSLRQSAERSDSKDGEMNHTGDLKGNLHGCKWTTGFDTIVQRESQPYDVVLQGDM